MFVDFLRVSNSWAQVNGRNAISWEDKFKLDVWYVEHQSLWLDARILWMTAREVLRRRQIDQPGYVGAEEFMGTRIGEPSTAGNVPSAVPLSTMPENDHRSSASRL
jgi:hypothetical protein